MALPAKPCLDVLGNLQVALHDHAVGQFEQQHDKDQQSAGQSQVEIKNVNLTRLIAIGVAAGKQQEDKPQQ